MASRDDFRGNLAELQRLATEVGETQAELVQVAGECLRDSLKAGGKVLACGNGGSAADAQHFVAELVVKMGEDRGPLPAIALSSDPSIVTALANDYGYERLFSRQVAAHGRGGDVLVALTTSGTSKNVLRALEQAFDRGLKTIVLTGSGGDGLLNRADFVLRVPSTNTQFIQELHLPMLHHLCAVAEEAAGSPLG